MWLERTDASQGPSRAVRSFVLGRLPVVPLEVYTPANTTCGIFHAMDRSKGESLSVIGLFAGIGDTDNRLRAAGWVVMRFWAHEDMKAAAREVARVVSRRVREAGPTVRRRRR